jgi:hypothetical protein
LMLVTPVSPFPIRLNQVQGHLSRLVTFRCEKVGQWLDLLGIFILAPLKEGTSCKEVTQPNALGPDLPQQLPVKALRLLQPAKDVNEGDGNGSGCFVRHKKAQRWDTVTKPVVTNSVVIPPEMMECLNKTEWRQIKSFWRWIREVLLHRSMFPEEDAVVWLLITQKSKSNKKKFVLSYPTG